MCRIAHLLTNAFALGLCLAIFVPQTGYAQDEEADEDDVATVVIQFWAYSANPEFYAYHTTNHLGDEVFFVGQANSLEPIYSQVADEDNTPRDILISREMRDAYGWAADGIPGTTSPSGYSDISINITGVTISIVAQQGHAVTPVGSVPLLTDESGRTLAECTISEVYWAAEETVAVVILHQVLGGSWPMEVDMAYGVTVPERPEPATP